MSIPLRLVLIGAGMWGQNWLRLAYARGYLAAIVDPEEQALAQAAQRAPRVPLFRSIEELFQAKLPLTAALIASPARTHCFLAQVALKMGLDVLVEKPLAIRVEEALALNELAKQQGRILMVGHLLRYHPAIECLLAEVAAGRIGRPLAIHSWRFSLPGRPSDVSALWALAPHDLSLLLALDHELIASHVFQLSNEQASFQMEMASGLLAYGMVSRCHTTKKRQILLTGEEAALSFDDLDPNAPLRLLRLRGCRWATEENLPVESQEPLARELDHFVSCLARRATPRTSGAEGLMVVRWLEKIQPLAAPLELPLPMLSPLALGARESSP